LSPPEPPLPDPLLSGAPSAESPRELNCLFKVDVNGILTVRAESADGEEAEVNFVHGSPSVAEVQARQQEAESHRAEDELTRRLLQLGRKMSELRDVVRGREADDTTIRSFDEVDAAIHVRDAECAAQLLADLRRRM